MIKVMASTTARTYARRCAFYSSTCARYAIVLAILLFSASSSWAATLTATWSANPEIDIAGYKLSYGTASGNYTTTLDVGNVTSYVLTVPDGQTYYFVVQAYDTSGLLSSRSTEVAYTVAGTPSPTITSLTPASGLVGTSVTITGTNFGATQSTSAVTFNGTPATPSSWSATSIVVSVPSGATTGSVLVTVNGAASNGLTYTVNSRPTLTSLAPTSGPVGTSVTITGTNFGSTKGTSSVSFNGTTAAPTSWSATSIVVPVPSGAITGNVIVIVGSASNALPFTVTTPAGPSLTSLSPASGLAGTAVTITGANFGATQGASTVTFNGTAATPTTWSASSIVVPAPSGAATGNVVVTVGGVASNGLLYTFGTQTAITLIQHASKSATTTTSSTLAFPGANTAGNWLAVMIRTSQPGQTFSVSDTRGNTYRRAVQFTDSADALTIGIFYAENIAGGANTVTVSDSMTGGNLRFAILEYAGVALSSSLDGTAAAQGTGTSVNSGTTTTTANGDLVIGLVSTATSSTVTPGTGFVAEERVSTKATRLMVEDRRQAAAGAMAATATLASSTGWGAAVAAFRAATGSAPAAPTLTSLSPTSGNVGASVTISGSNFGATQGTSAVTFNGTTATPSSWSATSIVVPVPSGATTGNVVVRVGGVVSNALPFTVTTTTPAAPSVTSLTPTSGPVGTSVSIAGANFGTTTGASTVTFNGTTATPTSWSATSIVVPVPSGATTGSVVVTVGGVASNASPFTVTTGGLLA